MKTRTMLMLAAMALAGCVAQVGAPEELRTSSSGLGTAPAKNDDTSESAEEEPSSDLKDLPTVVGHQGASSEAQENEAPGSPVPWRAPVQ